MYSKLFVLLVLVPITSCNVGKISLTNTFSKDAEDSLVGKEIYRYINHGGSIGITNESNDSLMIPALFFATDDSKFNTSIALFRKGKKGWELVNDYVSAHTTISFDLDLSNRVLLPKETLVEPYSVTRWYNNSVIKQDKNGVYMIQMRPGKYKVELCVLNCTLKNGTILPKQCIIDKFEVVREY